MTPILTQRWWALIVRGVLALGFAVLALAYPPATFAFLAIFVAAYLVLDGVFAILSGIRAAERHRRWWPFAAEGVLNLLAGAVIYLDPGVLVFLVAVWAVATGLLMLTPAVSLPGGTGRWLLILNGTVSLILGIAIIAQPIAGVVFIVWSVAIYALLFGIGLIALGVRVRRLHRQV